MKRQRWLIGILGAGVILTGPGTAAWAEDQPADVPRIITMRGQAMQVWPFDDLRARGFEIPEVADDDNAFWTYLEAINAYKEMPGDLVDAFDYATQTAWPAEGGEPLAAYLLHKDNQKALALVRQAANRETFQCYYFGDPKGSIMTVLLPSLSDYRTLAKLLVAEGRRLADQGAYDLAFRNYTTAYRMAHQVGGGITLIENLVGIAIRALADRAMVDLVLRPELSAGQLEAFLDELKALAPLCPDTVSGMRNERLFGTSIVDEITARPFHMLRNINAFTGSGGGEYSGSPLQQDNWRRLEARMGQVLLPDRTIKAHMNRYYDALAERAGQPAYLARWDQLDEEAIVSDIPKWNVLARILLPSLGRASVLGERTRMQARTVRVAAALRLYALENDGFAPERLADLTPWLPDEDLIDPFSGRDFVYDHRERVWRFYSISENFADDGGQTGDRAFDLDFVVRFPPTAPAPFEPDGQE